MELGLDRLRGAGAETCEPDAPHAIAQVAATEAVVVGTEMTEPVHQTPLARRELLADVPVVDAGYTTAALFPAATERGMELLSSVLHDSSCQSREDQGFSRADLTIDRPVPDLRPAGAATGGGRGGVVAGADACPVGVRGGVVDPVRIALTGCCRGEIVRLGQGPAQRQTA